jgi:hypothetical protein
MVDSAIAILWIKNRQVKTTLPRNSQTLPLWQEVEHKLHWLKTHSPAIPVLKWNNGDKFPLILAESKLSTPKTWHPP